MCAWAEVRLQFARDGTAWVPETELRLSGLAASAFTHWTISQAHKPACKYKLNIIVLTLRIRATWFPGCVFKGITSSYLSMFVPQQAIIYINIKKFAIILDYHKKIIYKSATTHVKFLNFQKTYEQVQISSA